MHRYFTCPAVLLAVGLRLLAQGEAPTWHTDFAAAKELAKQQQKLILADFTGSDWCGWCVKLKREVFDQPEFQSWAQKNVVLVELDYPKRTEQPAELRQQNQRLQQQYGVRAFPTILILDADGNRIGQLGYVAGGPAAWIPQAETQMQGVAQAQGKAGQAVPTTVQDPPTMPGWLTSQADALQTARRDGKAVLVAFTGSDWCQTSKQIRRDLLAAPDFVAWAATKVVLLEVDFPRRAKQSQPLKQQNRQIAEQHSVMAYPVLMLLDADGQAIATLDHRASDAKALTSAADRELVKRDEPK